MKRIAAHACALLLAGCATTYDNDPVYHWHESGYPPAQVYEWYRVNDVVRDAGCRPFSVGCSWLMTRIDGVRVCRVYSIHTEEEARRVYVELGSPVSHFDHEVGPGSKDGIVNPAAIIGHCAGWSHDKGAKH